ncbi:MAG: putative DNA binding domain-containing protein [Deltaproteobacteria bacterium]|nr:putative DNA binding domain-containing protein [Deltaproteobacteria bacterium]
MTFLQRLEGMDLEAKRALGSSGRGELPSDFFPTYSAFANTNGGLVLLGVAERHDGTLEVLGIPEPQRVQKNLWDSLNNPQRVSSNILTDADVQVVDVDGKNIIQVRVPRALRTQRPIFIGSNPMRGTYRRNHEGDYLCPDDVVRRMLAEQRDETRDADVLERFGMDDVNKETFRQYRQRYAARTPDHPWAREDDPSFLKAIGGWRRDRETEKEGLTAAGLLMFGNLNAIKEKFPFYMLDYQERPDAKRDLRWVDRLTTDGAWSGNLFDFYHLVFPRLVRDLKVPFALRGDTRVEETAVHEALREALVNTLIHADYTGRASVLVVKRPDLFGFRNPGTMRLPVDAVLQGGHSDCRNRRLQDMFRYVGLGEQAGSGIPKIRSAWKGQHWAAPDIQDQTEPLEQTLFTLRTVSLLPGDVMRGLETRFGTAEMAEVTEVQRLALVTVATEGKVSHPRLVGMIDQHPRDVSLALNALVRKGWLESSGAHKRTVYYFPGEPPKAADNGFGPDEPEVAPAGVASTATSEQSGPSSVQSAPSSVQSDSTVAEVSPPLTAEEEALAASLRSRKRISPAQLQEGILKLCGGRYLTLPQLASLTGKAPSTLRIHHLRPLVDQGRLVLRYPDAPTHPHQAYAANGQATGSHA